MGNAISYVGSHGKRLLNRYNAQFRALRYIDKEKLPSAPKHVLPPNLQEDPVPYEYFQKKDPNLDKILKDVYVKSHGEEPLISDQNPQKPLPLYTGSAKKNPFEEPAELTKGFCTLSQFFEFRTAHETDPVENSAAVIAKNYHLDVNKVENLLKYYSVFRLHEGKNKEHESEENDDSALLEFLKIAVKKNKLPDKTNLSGEAKSGGKTEKDMLQLETEKGEMKSNREEVKN